jgi:hypothetical protein
MPIVSLTYFEESFASLKQKKEEVKDKKNKE